MNHQERGDLRGIAGAQLSKSAGVVETAMLAGVYNVECRRLRQDRLSESMPLIQERVNIENAIAKRGLGTGWEYHRLTHIEQLLYPMQEVAWQDVAQNTVATVGKNLALDTFLAGSAYTVVGPYMGLISSVSWSATNAADTMGSHAGWTEAGATNAPTYSGTRKTAAWSAASAGSKALSAALAFTFTGAGTIKGCFLVYGSGALSTIDNTAGTLMSAGVFSGGDKTVANTDVVNVSYSLAF